jgi:phosphoserine phosphatase
MLKDRAALIEQFWKAHQSKMYQWYLSAKKNSDVIISAGPRFLIQPMCDRLGVTLIASEVDADTGRCASPNCNGAAKAARFREMFPRAVVDEFYSDSLGDTPMARLARRAYMVRGGKIADWPIIRR